MNRPAGLWLLLAIALFPRESVAAEDAAAEAAFLANTRALTLQGKRAGEGYFSADGRHLIFQSEREPDNPFYQIYILDLATGDTRRVSPGGGKTTCAFFRPGTNDVLFASTHHDPKAREKQKAEIEFRASGKERRYAWDYDEWFDIFSCDRDGAKLKRLTKAKGYDAEGAYSPDGRRIVFSSTRDAYSDKKLSKQDRKRLETDPSYFAEIYIMNADGSSPRRLTDWPGYDGGPFFSPNGDRIIWRHFDETGMNADVYTMRLDGSDRLRLTDFGAMSWAPFFHPSSEYVVFTSNKLGFSNFELFIVDALGQKEPVRVTFTDGFDGLPVFSPDGGRLAWTSNRGASGTSQLHVADWNHTAAVEALRAAPSRAGAVAGRRGGEVSAETIRKHVEYLASDELEGRMSGTEGTRRAAEYIAARLREVGLEPQGEGGTYLQEFPFTAGVRVIAEGNRLEVRTAGGKGTTFALDQDFRPLALTENAEVEGAVVFAGYGLRVPGEAASAYDSYQGLDVANKVVMVLRYVPEGVSAERRQELNMFAALQYKAMLAREDSARALLVVTGPNSPNAGELIPLRFEQNVKSCGIPVISISGRVADAILANSGKTLAELQTGLDDENPHFEGTLEVPGVTVALSTAVEREKKSDHNVIALLPPADPAVVPEYVVVGAHYDHIGHGEIGSLARSGEEGQIHNGADDNASGTSAVLELAAALSAARREKPESFRRGVLICLWSGEELGIIGSSFFVEHPPVDIGSVVAYLNFDMVGRLRENKLILQGSGSSGTWSRLIEKRNVAAGFNLVLQEDPYLPTDVTAFYPKNVPVLSFFTGSHEDYNRPTDDAATLDYAGMERIVRFAHGLVMDLVAEPERPAYARVERSKADTGSRGGMRVYLGTIPDYASDDIEGVKLAGVRAGGPAEKAGLLGGDVIVEFGGQKIKNIHDYTFALEAAKIGEPIEVVVLRNNERVALKVVPEARK